MNINIRDFAQANSGARVVRDLRIDARHESSNILATSFEQAVFYHRAQEALAYLLELRSEQAAVVDRLKTQLAESEAKLAGLPVVGWLGRDDARIAAEDERGKVDFQVDRECVPLFELDAAIKALRMVQRPACPAWLKEFLNS